MFPVIVTWRVVGFVAHFSMIWRRLQRPLVSCFPFNSQKTICGTGLSLPSSWRTRQPRQERLRRERLQENRTAFGRALSQRGWKAQVIGDKAHLAGPLVDTYL